MGGCVAVCRENSPAIQPEKLANKEHGSLSFRRVPPQVQPCSKKGAPTTRDIQHLPSSGDLERLRQAHDSKVVHDLEQSIQVNEAVRRMDDWTRKVWAARQYGYSWMEIAVHLGLTEPQAKLRFRYAIGRLRARLGRAA